MDKLLADSPTVEMKVPSTLRPFTNPILISDDDQIVAGHGRVEAAKLLGLERVPTIRLSHLSEAERRAYVLADNKLALNADRDQDLLAIELQALFLFASIAIALLARPGRRG